MTFVSIFIALRHPEADWVIERLRHDDSDGEYVGPISDRAHNIFSFMADQKNVQNLFKRATIGADEWSLWSISFEQKGKTLSLIRDELDWLIATYGSSPVRVSILGTWFWGGNQVGTEHVYSTRTVTKTWSVLNPDYQPDDQEPDFDDRFVLRITGDVEEEYISGYTGTPIYPIPTTQLMRFMPDVDGLPATVLSDRNLGMGQAPRSFL